MERRAKHTGKNTCWRCLHQLPPSTPSQGDAAQLIERPIYGSRPLHFLFTHSLHPSGHATTVHFTATLLRPQPRKQRLPIMKLPVLSEVIVNAVLALSALFEESRLRSLTTTRPPSGGQRSRRLGLARRAHVYPGTTPAPDLRFDNVLTRRAADQSVLSMKKKCKIQAAPTGGTPTNTTTTTPLQGPAGGLITVTDARCGPNGAVCE